MRNVLGPDTMLGYCTNVHAGANYAQMLDNLERYTLPIKEKVSPDAPMGVGLWLANDAAAQLIAQQRIGELKAWLAAHDLVAFTFNGFPYGNFHRDVVKHDVYLPTWADRPRLVYTLNLARILAQLTPEGGEAGISTLPLGWPQQGIPRKQGMEQAEQFLMELVNELTKLEATTGRLIHVDIEPEPGCAIDTADGIVEFFSEHLFRDGMEKNVRRYLRVCHDICHSAVMFEPQREALMKYRDAGIAVGKVQVSSAVRVNLTDENREAALQQLRAFDEPRYLHQTMLQYKNGSHDLFEDLPRALHAETENATELRTHFHVPLFLETFGHLQSTQSDVLELLGCVHELTNCKHFEAETYAWNVLPPDLRCQDLAQGIARELNWLRDQAANLKELACE